MLARTHVESALAFGERNIWSIAFFSVVLIAGLAGYLTFGGSSPGDRVVIGNTAGSITSLAELGDSRILIGAGPTRSHAADMIGRSTMPWDRGIDLLVLPGWDDYHAPGALGLLERREVAGVAIVGVPGEDPIWTLLEREAGAQDIPVRFIERPHHLELDKGVRLKLAATGEPDSASAFIWLDYNGALFEFTDSRRGSADERPPDIGPVANPHVVVSMRSITSDEPTDAALLVQPQPFVPSEFDDPPAVHVADVARNERVTMHLRDDSIQIPLDRLRD